MNLYEHTIIARQDTSPTEIQQLTDNIQKLLKKIKVKLSKLKIGV